MKLENMTDFVLRENEKWTKELDVMTHFNNVVAYANFLKQPLTLGMFVPCYDDDQIHEKPGDLAYQLAEENDHTASKWAIEEYNEAKERVLFKDAKFDRYGKLYCVGLLIGWTVPNGKFHIETEFKTIENVANESRKIELTDSAIKQIDL